MRVSQVGINLIKSFEGCRLVAYKDAAGVPTIGYGHTMGVKMGQTITQSQAEQMFVDDVTIFSDRVASLVKVSITQNQFDALTSLAYNIGVGGLKTSTLLEYLNAGNVSAAANEFGKWIHAGGKVLQGLVRRRAAEVALFLKDAPAPVQSQLAQQSVDELAQQVIAGKLGSGDARRQALGARYDEVQAKVNQILGGSKPAAPAQPAPTTTYTIRSGDS